MTADGGKKRLSIVVPCYNECRSLPVFLQRCASVITRVDIELILVNNGSTDDTQLVLDGLLPRYPFVRLVGIVANQGYGFGILAGLQAAQGEYMAWTHADMQTDPADVAKALDIIEHEPDPEKAFVKGVRRGRPFLDNFFTTGMGIFETVYLGVPLSDINAQPNLFHRSFFESWDNPPHDFALDLFAFYLARKKGLKVVRFPVIFEKRLHGHSHWNFGWKSKWRFITRTVEFSLKLKKRLP